jgi:hypothetical protein
MGTVLMYNLNEGDVFEKCLKDFYHNTDAPVLQIEPDNYIDRVYVTALDEYGDIYADFMLTLNQEEDDPAVILIDAEGDEDKYVYVIATGKTYTI